MGTGTPRPVRIRRLPEPHRPAADDQRTVSPRLGSRPGPESGELWNRAGIERSTRVFLLFAGLLLLLWILFLAAQLASPYAGVRDNVAAIAVLALIAAGAAVAGHRLTLGRTPLTVRGDDGSVVIRERSGRERRIPAAFAASPAAVHSHRPTLLGSEWTETVELEWPGGMRRAYLLEKGLLRRAAGQPPGSSGA
ncbi:MAG: hypothetical protein L3K04_07500 [Thermoplasmata archaeon]|nr:hypothetical protein [Thermoplasmata archaeon]MCI4341798.1 hypothetical protein [Thermoplasmata archaeon]